MAVNKTDLDEVREVRRKRHLKRMKEREEKLNPIKTPIKFSNRLTYH